VNSDRYKFRDFLLENRRIHPRDPVWEGAQGKRNHSANGEKNEIRPAPRSPPEVKKQAEADQTAIVKRPHRRIDLIYFFLASPRD
jgi:hypothetical protein